jgi:hypothetical protein
VVLRTLEADGGGDRYIRLVVTRGDGPLGLDPTRCEHGRVVCIVDTIALFSDEKRAAGLSLITSSFRRPPPDVLDPRMKSLNYLNNVLAKGEAVRQGADDALMLNMRGHVAETSVANVFVVRDGVLLTPPVTDGCLDGVTRTTVIECARELGIPVRRADARTHGRLRRRRGLHDRDRRRDRAHQQARRRAHRRRDDRRGDRAAQRGLPARHDARAGARPAVPRPRVLGRCSGTPGVPLVRLTTPARPRTRPWSSWASPT